MDDQGTRVGGDSTSGITFGGARNFTNCIAYFGGDRNFTRCVGGAGGDCGFNGSIAFGGARNRSRCCSGFNRPGDSPGMGWRVLNMAHSAINRRYARV